MRTTDQLISALRPGRKLQFYQNVVEFNKGCKSSKYVDAGRKVFIQFLCWSTQNRCFVQAIQQLQRKLQNSAIILKLYGIALVYKTTRNFKLTL